MALLVPAEYPAIRASLDLGLGADDLPDATIALPVYAGAAEAEVLRRVPGAESLPDPEKRRATNAAVYLAAALLAPALPAITSVRVGETQISRSPRETAAVSSALRAAADRELAAVLAAGAPVAAAARPRFFALAKGGRGA